MAKKKKKGKNKKGKIHTIVWIHPDTEFRTRTVAKMKVDFRPLCFDNLEAYQGSYLDERRIVIFDGNDESCSYSKEIAKRLGSLSKFSYITMVYDPVMTETQQKKWIEIGVKKENIIIEGLNPDQFAKAVLEAHKSAFRKK